MDHYDQNNIFFGATLRYFPFSDGYKLRQFLCLEEMVSSMHIQAHTLHAAPQATSATTIPADSLDSLDIRVVWTDVVLVRLLRVGVVLAPLPNTLELDQCHSSSVRRYH